MFDLQLIPLVLLLICDHVLKDRGTIFSPTQIELVHGPAIYVFLPVVQAGFSLE